VIIEIRRRGEGQAIVIMALAMVAICGMLALAIDAGRLYFQRRLMQDAVDAGALAGAQSLVGTTANPNGQPNYALFYGIQDSLSVFGQTPTTTDPNSAVYTAPVNSTVTDTKGGYTVTVVAPTGYNNKQVQVTVSYNAVATFVQVLGFNQINIVATATAEAGTNAKTYAIFAYTSGGSGNTINDDQNGVAQIDDGQDGADACNPSVNGYAVSNAKFHVPNPNTPKLNVNGVVTVDSASDNHSLYQYWQSPVGFGTSFDPEPNYLAPDTSTTANALNPSKKPIAPGTSAPVNGVVITNSSTTRTVYVLSPGKYTNTITIPATGNGENKDSIYVFLNGLYYFTSGANLTISGGYVSNTSNGLPKYGGSPAVGITDLPVASDGTNGIEFVFDQGSTFSASNSLLANDGSVFFVAPSFIPTGSTSVAFYIASTNTYTGAVWSETLNASASNVPRFQIWGTVFDASPSGSMTLTGVQLGPHNTSPSNTDSSGQYAITGEFIGATLQLNNGNVLGNGIGTPAVCMIPGTIGQGAPALLVQFNSKFAPKPGVNSYLIK
jgi:Flp pilus assembly protein TadG